MCRLSAYAPLNRPVRACDFWSLLYIALLCCGLGCGEVTKEPPRPHIVLISLDTMRQDHLGTYNPELSWLTPELDRFAEQAVVFERAYAPVPFTLPSHLSMLTGFYPDVHGVDEKNERLSENLSTLPEILRQVGFHNLGLVSNNWMKPEFGFERGFDRYERLDYDLTYSARLNRQLETWLDESSNTRGDSPLFLFLHYIDAHSDFFNVKRNLLPYYAPEEQLEALDVAGDPSRFCDEEENCATAFLAEANRLGGRPGHTLAPEQVEEIVRLYRAGILYLDRDLGQLFDLLRQRQLWENAMIIVTADHGEEFLEHGEFLHRQPYAENLSVPLMIKFPHGEWQGMRLDQVVETVDLVPTLLEWLDLEATLPLQGRSLLPLLRRQGRAKDIAFGRDKMNEQRFSLRSRDWTLIHDRVSGNSELYDARSDRAELNDLSAQHPEAVEQLVEMLERIVASNTRLSESYSSTAGEVLLTPEEQKQLQALGYLQ